jgi:hypothetical protein
LLEQPQFGSYNARVEESNAEIRKRATSAQDNSATLKDTIDFERRRELIDEFKREYIYAAMRAEEAQNRM